MKQYYSYLFFLIAFSFQLTAHAQTGSLFLTDTIQHKEFKLKTGRKVWFKLSGSDFVYHGLLKEIKEDTIRIRRMVIPIDSISMLSFRPKTVSKTFAIIYFSTYAGTLLVWATYDKMNPPKEYGAVPYSIYLALLSVIIVPTGIVITKMIHWNTPRREFYPTKNATIKTVLKPKIRGVFDM